MRAHAAMMVACLCDARARRVPGSGQFRVWARQRDPAGAVPGMCSQVGPWPPGLTSVRSACLGVPGGMVFPQAGYLLGQVL